MVSKRGKQWIQFSGEVYRHVEDYTVPQYGDFPDDQAEDFSVEDLKKHIKRYANRIGANVRGQEESNRDCLKIAHYACLLLAKYKNK